MDSSSSALTETVGQRIAREWWDTEQAGDDIFNLPDLAARIDAYAAEQYERHCAELAAIHGDLAALQSQVDQGERELDMAAAALNPLRAGDPANCLGQSMRDGAVIAAQIGRIREQRNEAQAALATLKVDYDNVLLRANTEAQLCVDLRVAQDTVIERCAVAVQDISPEAAARLRSHCGRPEDAHVAVSGDDFGQMQRENAALRAALATAQARTEQAERERDLVNDERRLVQHELDGMREHHGRGLCVSEAIYQTACAGRATLRDGMREARTERDALRDRLAAVEAERDAAIRAFKSTVGPQYETIIASLRDRLARVRAPSETGLNLLEQWERKINLEGATTPQLVAMAIDYLRRVLAVCQEGE